MIYTSSTKKTYAKLGSIFFFFLFLIPLVTTAQSMPPPPASGDKTGVVKGENNSGSLTYECEHVAPGDCTFEDVILAIQNLITFGRNIALGFSVVVLAIAGGRYMISGDNPGERIKANKMFVSVAWGIFFIMASWLIVDLITNALLGKSLVNPF